MSDGSSCPHCGVPLAAHHRSEAMDAVYGEVNRLRRLAEERAGSAAEARVAELTREVQELRATVARLRGSSVSAAPLPAPRSPVAS